MSCDDPGRGRWEEEQARASEDDARASASAAAEGEAEAKAAEALAPGMRVELQEERGSLLAINLGKVIKISKSGYVHVEWDDHTDGWFSPLKAAGCLKRATGDDALPRHLWIHEVTEQEAPGWTAGGGPLPTLDEPVCHFCREQQTDDNEFGPCRKAKL
jgi:hypothetical protein